MKPHEVRFHHIRDYPWPQTICTTCWRVVPEFHQHFPWEEDDVPAIPTVNPNARTRPEDFR